MRKLTKFLSAILVVVLCVQIIAPGTVAIGATQFVGDNIAMSAEEGITLNGIGATTPLLTSEQEFNNSSMPDETGGNPTSIVGEVNELRTESTKHFRHEDGTYTVATYPEPVHYMDSSGTWKEIDNTLTLNSKKKSISGKATYTPASTALDIRIPQDFSEKQMLTIGKDGYTIGVRIKTIDNALSINDSLSSTSNKVSSAKAIINNSFESMKITSASSSISTSVSDDLAVETANKEKLKLEKKVSAVNYNDILDGTDLQYIITPSKVKENIIVNKEQDSYVYQFELDLDGLIAVPQENGSIRLYENIEDNEAVFVIETPYMYDANEETSFDVKMSLNSNILTVTANAEWINDESRVFPVTIDPTFSTGSSTFYDATVGYGTPLLNYESYKYLYAGNGVLSLRRTYIKFDLPTIPDGSVVTKAELKLLQHDIDVGKENLYLYAIDLTGKSTWSESSITWNNQPLSKAKNGPQDDYTIKKLDYNTFILDNSSQEYVFNLTKSVKNWYEGSTNNGIMISSSNENKNTQTTLYSSDHSDGTLHPSVTIEYSNNIGIEDYWTYETRDLGRSGTIYANPYNGSITYLHNDLNMTGNLLPINIFHVYNSNIDEIYRTYYEGMYVGAKYHLNIQELLIPISSSDNMYSAGYRYKYYDSDGTLHYFKHTKISSNVYKTLLEYDPTVYVSYTSSYRMINYSDGSKKYFYNDGRLYKIVDNNGNTQTFTYDGKKITRITDPVGRVAVLTYNIYGQLESITDPSGRNVSYAYGDTTPTAHLTSITYPDGKQTVITYTTNDYLYKLTAIDNSFLRFYYKTVSARGRRVNWIDPYDKNGKRIDEIKFTYTATNESGTASGNTVISNNYDESKTFLFDKYGRAISKTNQYGQSQYAVYGNDVANNSDEFNKILSSSNLLTISGNLLSNHGFEKNDYWSVLQTAPTGSCDYSTEESSYGYRSLKMELSENGGIYEVGQDFDAIAGKSYTLSVDIYIPKKLNVLDNNGVSFGFVYCLDGVWHTESNRWLTSTSGWERFSHTVTIPEGTLTTCRVFIELARAEGSVYFDSIQLENSAGARYYNLVENSNFSNTPNVAEGVDAVAATAYAWEKAGTQGDDGVYTVNGRNYVFMSGSPDHNKRIAQNIPINAKAGDTMIIGGRAGAYATDGENDGRYFRAYAELYDGNLCFDTVTIDFDRSVNQEHQTRASVIRLSRDCEYIIYYFVYFYHLDSVSFDDAFIYLDKYGEHYDYENGLLDSSYNDEGKTTSYTYSNNNVTKITEKVSGVEQTVANYEYDSSHNITTAINNIGTKIEYEYNDAGQITKQITVTTDENGEEITTTESFAYYQNGNYIRGYTNDAEGTTLYVYDNDNSGENITKGLVTSITDSIGNVTTYTYDPNTDELLSTSGEAEPSVLSTTSFTYENYLPKTITKNGTTYSYEYDAQNRITSSKVGTQVLTTNSYDNDQRLSQTAYANNDVYRPVYDSRNRLLGESWNGNQISEYYYNNNDRLSKRVDNVTNTSYQYDYAFYDLPFRITGSDGTMTTYDYDRSGTLARLTFSDDNVNIYSGKYYTNEKGMPEDVVIDTLDNTLIHYNYDELGRVESYSYGPVVRTIKYKDGATNNVATTNNQIEEIIDKTKDGAHLQVYYFEYNDDGSFYLSYEGVDGQSFDYIYDGLGRVIENYTSDDLYVYSYDTAGNITSVGIWYEPIHTFTYGNENWKDQLTAFDGKAITYDANGNPLTFDGYNYTWQRGNQLAGMTGNGKNISYVYDSQGNRIQKTVNNITTSYLYSGDLLMRQTDGTNILDFQYDSNGNVVGFVYNGEPYYYLRSLLNDVSGIVDGDGNVVAKYRYDAYGNTIYSIGIMAEINPIRYRGYYYDIETNWYYLQSRYYNPEWCRFISPDSLFVAGDAITGNNMYAYCNNDPVSHIDPSGTNALDWIKEKITEKVKESKLISSLHNKIANEVSQYISGRIGEEIMEPGSEILFTNGLKPYISSVMDSLYSNIFWDTLWKDRLYPFRNFPLLQLRTHSIDDLSVFAGIGAMVLDFHENVDWNSPNYGNYTTLNGSYQWQKLVGYNWWYDWFFSLGGPNEAVKFPFVSNDIIYVVWCWKADYWNLGAGAEIGIYYQPNHILASDGYFEIDENNLQLRVLMNVDYYANGRENEPDHLTTDFEQTNWWVTSFTPRIQSADINLLDVNLKVAFVDNNTHPNLMKSFYETGCIKKSPDSTDPDDWPKLEWADTERKFLHWEHCDKHPTQCICSNPPCHKYSDDGYQFYIKY